MSFYEHFRDKEKQGRKYWYHLIYIEYRGYAQGGITFSPFTTATSGGSALPVPAKLAFRVARRLAGVGSQSVKNPQSNKLSIKTLKLLDTNNKLSNSFSFPNSCSQKRISPKFFSDIQIQI